MGMINKAQASAHEAVDQVAEAAAPAAKWLEGKGDQLSAGGEKLMDSTCKYIAANPFKSLGMALAAGYLISRLTR
jgi:ElaB/YqjD/DUF883 family membrane-anchored ribosome-binding protein